MAVNREMSKKILEKINTLLYDLMRRAEEI